MSPTAPNTNTSQLDTEHVVNQPIPDQTDSQTQSTPDQQTETQSQVNPSTQMNTELNHQTLIDFESQIDIYCDTNQPTVSHGSIPTGPGVEVQTIDDDDKEQVEVHIPKLCIPRMDPEEKLKCITARAMNRVLGPCNDVTTFDNLHNQLKHTQSFATNGHLKQQYQ